MQSKEILGPVQSVLASISRASKAGKKQKKASGGQQMAKMPNTWRLQGLARTDMTYLER